MKLKVPIRASSSGTRLSARGLRWHFWLLRMLEASADPTHPDHAEISDWLDGYAPEELHVFPLHVDFGGIAGRRNAAAMRILKPAND